MTLKQVSQRAYDYAAAAQVCEKRQGSYTARAKKNDTRDPNIDSFNQQNNMPGPTNTNNSGYTPSFSAVQNSSSSQTPNSLDTGNGILSAFPTELAEGWGNALQHAGLSDFSDVTKNLGYVLAMLPDMIIGMFTGKNPNLQLEDNLLPLA